MKTQGIKYSGSKLKLIPHILETCGVVRPKSVLDGFAGTTRVSQAFAKSGYLVHSNDISEWSEVFNVCYLLNSGNINYYTDLIDHLNNVAPLDGWFSEHYGGKPQDVKKPFQIHNTMKLDGIRAEIDRLGLSKLDKSIALTSLMLALDKVDSTIGHFSSYLSRWSPRSYKNMELKLPEIFPVLEKHKVYKGDIFSILPGIEVDLAYFDPPYGSNNEKMPSSRVRYAAYYHFWTTVCLNDRPELFGKVGRRKDSSDKQCGSVFEEFRKDTDGKNLSVSAIQRLLSEVKAKHVVLSYSSGGRASKEELFEVISSVGKLVSVSEVDYKKNVMSNMRWTFDWVKEETTHKEYLFLIKK